MVREPYLVKDLIPVVSDGKKGHVSTCTHCGAPATKQAYLKREGLILVERYCNACLQPDTFEQLQAVYARFD